MKSRKELRKLIKSTVTEAAKKILPEKVILFGSYAYGKPNQDSDVDLLFIKKTNLSRMERHVFVNTYLEHFMPMDILIKTPSEVQKRLKMGDPFYKEIIKKGEVIFNGAK